MTLDSQSQTQLLTAARTIARFGLSDAFGHLSIRDSADTLIITALKPLALLTEADQPTMINFDASALPPGAPKEAWIHLALMRDRPGVGAVCRAQPPQVAAFTALNHDLDQLNGHAAMLGEVAIYPDSRLIRDADSGARVGAAIGNADVVVLRGNGAVTRGADLAQAVARMWLLERTAELNLRAHAAGSPIAISPDEAAWWREQAAELLPRIYHYLTQTR